MGADWFDAPHPTEARSSSQASLGSGFQQRQVVGPPAEDGFGRESQPPVEERGIDPAEVDRPFQVAVNQVAEPGRQADQARLDRSRDQLQVGRARAIGEATAIDSGDPAPRQGSHEDSLNRF